ncbi:hypothetical protein [Terriglobus albidus]|uniref:hypothetical protein n=1 Tax=Terriglobus albidus TaxID=1592106 RepID=UPI0021E0F265|nr:hypothetical protein [Terriglobus albidus]
MKENTGTTAAPQHPIQEKMSIGERIWRVIDNSSFQTTLGWLGGIAGTFLDGRYFVLLGPVVPYAVFRAKSLEGLSPARKFGIYMVTLVIACSGLFKMGVSVNKKRGGTTTPSENRAAISEGKPPPIVQQITNIYPSAKKERAAEPRIDLSEFMLDSVEPGGRVYNLHVDGVNNGSSVARQSRGATYWAIGGREDRTEDKLFEYLYARSKDKDQPVADQPPGEKNSVFMPTYLGPLSDKDMIDVQQSGKRIYVGRLETYLDDDGNKYSTEICQYFRPGDGLLHFCDGHNRSGRLKR